jgi:hypothetical protein
MRRNYICKIPFIDKKSITTLKKEKAGTKDSGKQAYAKIFRPNSPNFASGQGTKRQYTAIIWERKCGT